MSSVQRAISTSALQGTIAGHWRVIAKPWGAPAVDITMFRGAPTQIGNFGFADPFGPQDMDLTFEQVTVFEELGVGDLFWCSKHVDVDVVWVGPLPLGWKRWSFEGYIDTFSRSNSGLSLQLKGSGLQLDNWLAKPEYPSRPLPYEWAIARQFRGRPSLRLHPLKIIWPSNWAKKYVPPKKGTPSYLIPAGVTKGQNWTGLLTRQTGSWDPVLTSYIQGMLSAMYDERGRWTIDIEPGRLPVMFRRDFTSTVDDQTVVIDLAAPGVAFNLQEDWEQTLTTVYGQGSGLNGVTYSGMNVSPDGSSTSYQPLAYLRQAYPERVDNGWRDRSVMPKEVMLQMQQGLSQDDAAIVARAHLSRFAEPGVTGTLTLKSDPVVDGIRIPRHLVRAGMSVHLPRAWGRENGLIGHITNSSHSIEDGSVELTVDTKFRDALTVEEVRLRGRDALSVSRMLVAGQYKPPVDDQMLPWSYAEGSGVIPSNPKYNATRLFNSMPQDVGFPWTQWTTTHPPKSSKWKSCYLRLGPTQNTADKNWLVQDQVNGRSMGIPIKVAQAGTIRLLQMAAYDADGNVLKVPFHVSFYYVGGVNVMSMPRIPAEQKSMFPPYRAGQHYPYVRDGWEAFKIDGTKNDPNIPQPTQSVGLIKAYGNYYEKAGYWPGMYSDGDLPTGLLVDEQGFTFDVTSVADAYWDPYRAERNLTNPKSGYIYAMIYCDAQRSQEVFFLGRLFRAEPGSGGN